MTNAETTAMMKALRTEGHYFDGKTLYVMENFHKAASQFDTAQYKKIMGMLAYYPDTQVEVVNTAAGRAVNEINVMSYEMMVRYICLLPEKEKYLKEMKRAKLVSHSHKSPYKFMRKWFAETFPDYAMMLEFDENGKLKLKSTVREEETDAVLEALPKNVSYMEAV